jgi:bacteriocin biosynthesis cyclodehydratase domain-containing protein
VDDDRRSRTACGTLGRVRPILRPGTHALTRLGGDLQIGLDPALAVVVPDSPAVRRTVSLLTSGSERRCYDQPELAEALEQLDRHAVLADERHVLPLLRRDAGTGAAAAAVARSRGSDAVRAWRNRARCRTAVRGFGPGSDVLGQDLSRLLARAGLAGDPAAPDRRQPDVGLLVGVGEPHREELDDWVRSGVPHLLLRLTEGRAVLGPFVAPGRTACVRCIDAHRTDVDDSWPLLVRQYAAATAQPRPDGVPEPVDPLLAALAVAWVARDLATYVEGGRPATWSATLTLEPDLSELHSQAWLRHPGCCCSWD